jgi:hypothetical protein
MQEINVIIEVNKEVLEYPETFIFEESAGKRFESIVTSGKVKFRNKRLMKLGGLMQEPLMSINPRKTVSTGMLPTMAGCMKRMVKRLSL